MNINAAEVKNFRTKLGWTQQVLADACDLSLRTIQRVERYGTASTETMMSLCAVFEIEQEVLIVEDDIEAQITRENPFSINPFALVIISTISGTFAGAILMYFLMR